MHFAPCPMTIFVEIGKFLGPVIMERISKQKKRGLEQIQTGLSCDRAEAEKLLHKVYQHIGMSESLHGNAVHAAACQGKRPYR